MNTKKATTTKKNEELNLDCVIVTQTSKMRASVQLDKMYWCEHGGLAASLVCGTSGCSGS